MPRDLNCYCESNSRNYCPVHSRQTEPPIPNLSDYGMSPKIGGFVALHRFEDGQVWLMRRHVSDSWVTVRPATDADFETMERSGLLYREGREEMARRVAQSRATT